MSAATSPNSDAWATPARPAAPDSRPGSPCFAGAAQLIVLPFPSAVLSGHNTGSHWVKAPAVAKHREWAKNATQAESITVAPTGDIPVLVRFIPPDRRGDRLNFPNRCKPYFDGIADALKTNDARFLPFFQYLPPGKPGRVEIVIGTGEPA